MQETLNAVSISVRHLVEHVFRSGSIDVKHHLVQSLQEGTKAHQRVQGKYGELDRREVYVKSEIMLDDLLITVDGRCDGLLLESDEEDAPPMVDEIKSTSGDISSITEHSFPVHWAQAMFYAYMYAKEHAEPRMRIQLTYVQTESEEERRFRRESAFAELELFVYEIAEQYALYARMLKHHEKQRDESIERLQFPYDAYRAGQRKLAGAVYKTIEEGQKLFARAPTGIGKTISTTFPAVKAIGTGMLQRFFYLTARTTTRAAAEDALLLMDAKGLMLHAVTITAKDKICFQAETRCEKEHCPYADGYYDRINPAIMDLLANETIMTRAVIEQYAKKHQVCPFEFSLDASYAADAVICDYNYIFDPVISLKRQYNEGKKRTALLVDEAHNLVDRGREMFSAELTKSAFLSLQRELKGKQEAGYRSAKAINDYFIAMRKAYGDETHMVEKSLPTDLVALVQSFVQTAEQVLGSSVEPASELLLEAYFAAQSFIRTAKLFNDRYVVFTELSRSEVRLKLLCIDPSEQLQAMGKGYRAHIYFSATLSPVSFYMDMLGGGEQDYTLSVPSPFAKEQLSVSIEPLSTRYQDRERSYEPIARLIKQATEQRIGNYMAFFPSYAYMEAVHEAYIKLLQSESESVTKEAATVLLQSKIMTEEEREQFLAAFEEGGKRPVLAFAIMGGIFSEGIDLVGDRLIGVIITGVGLPQLGVERNAIKDYFNGIGKNGYDYAYVYPGMNKVLQAGGRLIRSEDDSGSLTLIDDRYLQPMYARLLPEEWK